MHAATHRAHFIALDLMDRMLDYDWKTRITAEEALQHAFFVSAGYTAPPPPAVDLFDWSFSTTGLHGWRGMSALSSLKIVGYICMAVCTHVLCIDAIFAVMADFVQRSQSNSALLTFADTTPT